MHSPCAPELFLGQKYEGLAGETWGLGVVLYTAVTGNPLLFFQGKELQGAVVVDAEQKIPRDMFCIF